MARIGVVACAAVAVATCMAFAASSDASMRRSVIEGPLQATPFALRRPVAKLPAVAKHAVSPLFATELTALTRRGISRGVANQAIGVQGVVAHVGLVSKLEGALGRAFAGVWFDNQAAQLDVGVTSPMSRRTAARVVAAAGLTGHVTEISVRSTWTQLLKAQTQWARRLAGQAVGPDVETSVDPQRNAVFVTLSSAVSPAKLAALKRATSSAPVTVVVAVATSRDLSVTAATSTSCKAFVSGEANCERPIASGVSIGTSVVNFCTGGPMAIPSGIKKNKTVLLTAGHCIISKGESIFAGAPSGTKAEIGKVADFSFSKSGDYAEITVEPGFWALSETKDPVFAITAVWTKGGTKTYPVVGSEKPVMNAIVCHEGRISGHSCGTIVKPSTEITFSKTLKIPGMVMTEGAVSLRGDSGGPWYFLDSKSAIFMEGIMSAVGSLPSGGIETKVGYFQPLGPVLANLGLELLTTANEARP